MEAPALISPAFTKAAQALRLGRVRIYGKIRTKIRVLAREMRGRSAWMHVRYATFGPKFGGDCGGLTRTEFDAQNEETDPLDNPPAEYVVPL
jgi:hypothetical protein